MPFIHVPDHVENPEAYIRAAQARIEANARKGRRDRWFAADASREALMSRVFDASQRSQFMAKMLDAFDKWGSLTENQERAVRESFARDEARKNEQRARDAATVHVGTVGDRCAFSAVVAFTTSYESAYGTTYVVGFRDASNNAIIAKATRRIDVEKGDAVNFTAFVKAHAVRDGAPQTIVNRIKVTSRVARSVE